MRFHLKLELPGVDVKDLDVQVTENTVAISGERKSENKTEENGHTVHRIPLWQIPTRDSFKHSRSKYQCHSRIQRRHFEFDTTQN